MAKVFISSVVKDFSSFRDSARKTVKSLGHSPIMCEDFLPDGRSSKEACIQGVEAADIVICILGARFGFEVMPNVSASELEYETAIRLNKKILGFAQKCAMDQKQKKFMDKIGDFQEGQFLAFFESELDLVLAITASLSQTQQHGPKVSEDEFCRIVSEAKKKLGIQYHRSGPQLTVGLWPPGQRELDLTTFEEGLEGIAKSLISAKFIQEDEKWELVSEKDWAGIKFGSYHQNSVLSFHENNLVLAVIDPRVSGGHPFSDSFVSPKRIEEIIKMTGSRFSGSSAWVNLVLEEMGFKILEEPPENSFRSFSIKFRSDEENKYISNEFFSPFRAREYAEWTALQIKKMKRRFN